MKIGIGLKKFAYTPEAYAYEAYLTQKGVCVQLEDESRISPENDINIFFMGFTLPSSRKKKSSLEVHEYQSLSTPPMAHLKDFLKTKLNTTPAGRIFLNSSVKKNLEFTADTPYIYRDMGVDEDLFQTPSSNPVYDIIYCGSLSGRPGLVDEINRLAFLGFNILVVGEVNKKTKSEFITKKNIEFTGRVSRKELPAIFKNCRAGLNYTPDLYPFNIQTSTKTLEYLASGLAVITNRYHWSDLFFHKNKITPIYLDAINEFQHIEPPINNICKMEKYKWRNVLDQSNLYNFLVGILK